MDRQQVQRLARIAVEDLADIEAVVSQAFPSNNGEVHAVLVQCAVQLYLEEKRRWQAEFGA